MTVWIISTQQHVANKQMRGIHAYQNVSAENFMNVPDVWKVKRPPTTLRTGIAGGSAAVHGDTAQQDVLSDEELASTIERILPDLSEAEQKFVHFFTDLKNAEGGALTDMLLPLVQAGSEENTGAANNYGEFVAKTIGSDVVTNESTLTDTDKRTVFLTKLPGSASEFSVKEFLSSCGTILAVSFNKQRRTASVEFQEASSVEKAIATRHMMLMHGSRVDVAQKRSFIKQAVRAPSDKVYKK